MKTYEHMDSLQQAIRVGESIAFTSSYLNGVKIGTVVKLTRVRVKIKYTYTYRTREGTSEKSSWTTLIAPERTIQLSDELPHSLTWHRLKNS